MTMRIGRLIPRGSLTNSDTIIGRWPSPGLTDPEDSSCWPGDLIRREVSDSIEMCCVQPWSTVLPPRRYEPHEGLGTCPTSRVLLFLRFVNVAV